MLNDIKLTANILDVSVTRERKNGVRIDFLNSAYDYRQVPSESTRLHRPRRT